MSVQISIYDTATRERQERHVNANLDDAKEIAIGWLESLGGLRGKSLKVTTSRGACYAARPREKNTGPGRYVWVKE